MKNVWITLEGNIAKCKLQWSLHGIFFLLFSFPYSPNVLYYKHLCIIIKEEKKKTKMSKLIKEVVRALASVIGGHGLTHWRVTVKVMSTTRATGLAEVV